MAARTAVLELIQKSKNEYENVPIKAVKDLLAEAAGMVLQTFIIHMYFVSKFLNQSNSRTWKYIDSKESRSTTRDR
jgi:hypothetical protein